LAGELEKLSLYGVSGPGREAGFDKMNPSSYNMAKEAYAPRIMGENNNSKLRDHIYAPFKMGDLE